MNNFSCNLSCTWMPIIECLFYAFDSFVEPQISHFANFTLWRIGTNSSHRLKKLVSKRHIFHTNISHFVKFAHLVKLYVAYMRNLHIDKKNTQICCILQSIPILHIL